MSLEERGGEERDKHMKCELEVGSNLKVEFLVFGHNSEGLTAEHVC